MTTLLAALLLFPLAQGAPAQTGDPQAGKTLWDGPTTQCRNCHGTNGEGAFGPDLAGRKLAVPQFRQAIRKPWGIMPAYLESQITDREIADMVAYFDSLPSVAQPGPWRFDVPAGAPRGQELLLATIGCGQCHGPTLNNPRQGAGAIGAEFQWFKEMVYDHTGAMPRHSQVLGEKGPPRLRMGNYSPSRLPESLLMDVWTWARDVGFRAPVRGSLSAGAAGPNGVTYTLTVENYGLPGKALTAEDLTISLVLPAGATVVSTTGDGYQGVRVDPEAKANAAVWQTGRMEPKDRRTYVLTLSRAGTAQDNVRGSIRWMRPAVKTGPNDNVVIAPAPIPR